MNDLVEQQKTTTLEGTLRHVYDGVQCIADIDAVGVSVVAVQYVASVSWSCLAFTDLSHFMV